MKIHMLPATDSEAMPTRIANASNRYQGNYKKVLCVCSGGLLRSPTAAVVLGGEPYNFNTRSCGLEADYALTLLNDALLCWADEILCMEEGHAEVINAKIAAIEGGIKAKLIVLDIPDRFPYRDPELIEMIKVKYAPYLLAPS